MCWDHNSMKWLYLNFFSWLWKHQLSKKASDKDIKTIFLYVNIPHLTMHKFEPWIY